MMKLAKAPLLPQAKGHVLRNVADRLFLSSMQCRQLLGSFGEPESRIQVRREAWRGRRYDRH